MTLLSLPICAWTWSWVFRLFFLQLSYVHRCFDRCCQDVLKCFQLAIKMKGYCEHRKMWKQRKTSGLDISGANTSRRRNDYKCMFSVKATTRSILQHKKGRCSQMANAGISFVTEEVQKAGWSLWLRAANITQSLQTQERSFNVNIGGGGLILHSPELLIRHPVFF